MTNWPIWLRPLVWRLAPALAAERDRRYQIRVRESFAEPASVREWIRENGTRVTAGPLAGLYYPVSLIERADAVVLKLNGDYEAEIHSAIQSAIDALRGSIGSVFIDIGSSEGYYAVGVARVVGCLTIAFEAAPSARRATRKLAAANGVAVDARGTATERRLLRVAPRASAVLCDIEGGEWSVMTERVARALSSAVVIIELHGSRAIAEVPERFSGSHHVEVVPCVQRGLRVGPTPWLVATPRSDVELGSYRQV